MPKVLKIGSNVSYAPTDTKHICDFCDGGAYFRDKDNQIKRENDIIMCSNCLQELFVSLREGLERFKQ